MPISAKHPLFKIWDEEPTVLAIEGSIVCSIAATSPIILQNNCDLDLDTSSLWSPNSNIDDLAVIYARIYKAWRRRSGFGLLPPYDVYKEAVPKGFELLPHFPNSLASLLVLHTLGEKAPTRSCSLSSRRIATLSNGRIAIVPGSSLPGDFVCRFEDSFDHWVLRDKDDVPSRSALDRQVVHQFNDYEYGKPRVRARAPRRWVDNPPTHTVFIGESFVDKAIGGDERELRIPSIFIIH
jgi:hypothetical protein